MGVIDDVSSGAGTGLAFGPQGAIIGGIAGLGLAGLKFLTGQGQKNKANAMHPVNPGYTVNQEVIDNARISGDNYANYRLPGYTQLMSSIDRNFNDSFSKAEQGASSSGDVLDAANKLQLGKGQQLNQVAAQNAQGKQSALMQYLAAKAAAGAEYQDKNAYDRGEYEKQLQLKNQLYNNGTLNQYGAADQAGRLVASLFTNHNTPTTGVTDVSKGASLF